MTFPAKVFLSFIAAFALAAGLVFSAAISGLRRTYGQMEQGQVSAAFENARREIERGAEDVTRRVSLVAESEATVRMALDLSRAQPDYSIYANDASGAARTHGLELFEFVSSEGMVISSTEALGSEGRREDWVVPAAQATGGRAFLRRWTDNGQAAIAQVAVREIPVGEKKLYVVGGRLVNYHLLALLPLASGTHAMLLVNAGGKCDSPLLWDAAGAPASPGSAAEFLARVCKNPAAGGEGNRFADSVARENDYALPLSALDQSVLGAVVISYSSAAQAAEEQVMWRRLLLALLIGVLAGSALSYASVKGMVRPLVRLTRSARDIAALSPSARAEERGSPEVVALARALNQAAQKLAAERERSLQAERVAAWREMTRRTTAEIEAALEALGEARDSGNVAEGIASFERVLERFRDFGDLLVLPMQSVRLNDIVRSVLRDIEPLFNPAISDVSRPPVTPEISLAEDVPSIRADSSALARALDTLLLYAVYSMSAGGTFLLRTERIPGFAVLRIEWPAAFPNVEEAARMFSSTPVKRSYAAGLELATAQAIIADHDGTVETVSSETTSALIIKLPEVPVTPAAGATESEPTPIAGHAPASPLS